MKKILRNILSFGMIGTFIGVLDSLFFSYFNHSAQYYPSTPAFVARFHRPLDAVAISLVLWIIMGQLFGFGSLIFNIKHWSLLKKTVINFIAYYLGFIPLAASAGWFSLNWANFLIFTIIFLIIYAVIWIINLYLALADIKKVNQKVKEKKEQQTS